MSTAREELASTIGEQFEHPAGPNCPICADAYRAADAILAAGYRKPRTIEDVGSRDALPDGAVVMSSAGTMACKFDSSRGVMFGMSLPFPWKNLALPLTVLWEPLP